MAPDCALDACSSILSKLHAWLTSASRSVAGGERCPPGSPRPKPIQTAAYGLPDVPCLVFWMRKRRQSCAPCSSPSLVFPGPVLELEANHLHVPSLPLVLIPGKINNTARQPGPQNQPGRVEQWSGGKGRWGGGSGRSNSVCVCVCVCVRGTHGCWGWLGVINVMMLIIHLLTASFSHGCC